MKSNTKWIIGIVAGTIAGAAIALILAPEKGTDIRKQIRQSGSKLSEKSNRFFKGMAKRFNRGEQKLTGKNEVIPG